jgi:cytochrome oxidase Cu insertion factor (SCO1/SenC/PrrC family)
MSVAPTARDAWRGWGAAAVAFVLAVTAAWWLLALWPAPEEPPAWLLRTRQVCFNAGLDGLPDASGWLLLVGQPLGMLAVLMAGWGGAVRRDLAALASRRAGRAALLAVVVACTGGLAAAGARVQAVSADAPARAAVPTTWPRLDRAAPPLGLIDQRGERLAVDALRGRPALVTFAFGQCESVCPLVVRETLEAQSRLRAREPEARVPRVVVVTLDPWRDTPSRLDHLAHHWKLGDDGFVLSGEVAEVNRVLDAWGIARERDPDTGDVAHPPLVYVLDAEGRLAYAATGDPQILAELVERS